LASQTQKKQKTCPS